ncbi:MAG: flavin reductase family protein [Eubacterium sp.]|nr:flavin reductase family protein [Eubacterium sp.]
MAKISMKPGTMLNPVPAVMVSCSDGERDNILTIAWTGIINSDPPLTYVSIRKSRYSHELISKSGCFVINIVTEDLARAADYCGVRSGSKEDKFSKCNLTKMSAEKVTAPMIAESPVNLECELIEVKTYPTHDMFVAEIVRVHADEKLFDEDGRIRLDKAELVAYNHGEYFGLKKKALGRFGFSVMKKNTKKRINREAKRKRQKKK